MCQYFRLSLFDKAPLIGLAPLGSAEWDIVGFYYYFLFKLFDFATDIIG